MKSALRDLQTSAHDVALSVGRAQMMQEQVRAYQQTHRELVERGTYIVKAFNKSGHVYNVSIMDIDDPVGTVTIGYDWRSDSESLTVPIDFLWRDDIDSAIAQKKLDDAERDRIDYERRQEAQRAKIEAQERATYAALQKKYGVTVP